MRRPRAPRLDRGRSHPPRRRLPPDAPRRHAHRPATHRPNRRADHQAPRPGRRRPPENLSGHSLRAGYATAAAAAGIEERKIANVTRHKNLPVPRRFIRTATAYDDVGEVLLKCSPRFQYLFSGVVYAERRLRSSAASIRASSAPSEFPGATRAVKAPELGRDESDLSARSDQLPNGVGGQLAAGIRAASGR